MRTPERLQTIFARVRARPLAWLGEGSYLYELQNSPWHVCTVNWLDVVEAIPEAEDKLPEFVRVHKRSGHRTIHVYGFDTGQSSKQEILDTCNQLGAT